MTKIKCLFSLNYYILSLNKWQKNKASQRNNQGKYSLKEDLNKKCLRYLGDPV